uniref:Uncharacterized protein n=1 Tax=Utricularia reniformis TaxID=192314 RepID=A0A1Y0B4M7_9LAMI|nr:hypothetical protein AEK19_MT2204 [Utricularia reniformis]ART32350.1 hypothetical protein AEK19_MT2204 [Utricularia reniformis]
MSNPLRVTYDESSVTVQVHEPDLKTIEPCASPSDPIRHNQLFD